MISRNRALNPGCFGASGSRGPTHEPDRRTAQRARWKTSAPTCCSSPGCSSTAGRATASTGPISSSKRCSRPMQRRTSLPATIPHWQPGCGRRWSTTCAKPGAPAPCQARHPPRTGPRRSRRAIVGPAGGHPCRTALFAKPAPVRNEDLLRLADALTQLPAAQREAIILHHLQGASLTETAERLGRTDAAVAGLLHRGLRKLREVLAQDSGE